MEGSAAHTCLPSGAIQGLTTSPRVMLKEPDSVFSYIKEVNSVFMALGTKSARMSILERMCWVAEDKHNIGFQQYTCDHPMGLPQRGCIVPPACSPGQEVPILCLPWEREQSLREHHYLKRCAEQLHDVGRVLLEHPDPRDGEILLQLLQTHKSL